MEAQALPLALRNFNDDAEARGQIYSPLTLISKAQLRKSAYSGRNCENFSPLFADSTPNQPQLIIHIKQQQKKADVKKQVHKDANLQRIIKNVKQKNSKSSESSKNSEALTTALFSFNLDPVISFSQTPKFKQSMESPLKSFNQLQETRILELYRTNYPKQRFKEICLKSNPSFYKDQPGSYFMGMALYLRKEGRAAESLFLFHIAAYMEPYNPKVWQQYCQALKKLGLWRKSAVVAKAGFLFTAASNLGQQYLSCAEKAGIPYYQVRGLLSSLAEPQKFERLIFQSGKGEIKNRKIWRGFQLLFCFLAKQQFRPTLSQVSTFVAKNLQYMGLRQLSMRLLRKSISNKLSKYEAFALYIENCVRQTGSISKQQINFITSRVEALAAETRYRVFVDIAEALPRDQTSKVAFCYQEALQTAKKCCVEDKNQKRASRHIYLSILSKYSSLLLDSESNYPSQKDEHMKFLANKARFMKGQPLKEHKFQDWKYYLHYCLSGGEHVLRLAYEEHQQGRLLAEYIHLLRARRSPLAVLYLWRAKIDECPKSGELWCEGARIFLDLHEHTNAKKCLLAAIHFTPQYGDSFIELMKVHLYENSFYEMNQLRKNFITSEPFYGNVFSFLRCSRPKQLNQKLSLSETWVQALKEVQESFYGPGQGQPSLTAIPSYNAAFLNPGSAEVREKLFMSYELIDNRFSK